MLQKIVSAYDVTYLETGLLGTVVSLSGVYNGDADIFVQIHDQTKMQNDDVPLWETQIYKGVPFEFLSFIDKPLRFATAISVAFSSTSGALTLVEGVGNTGDFQVGVEYVPSNLPVGYSTAGDLTTDVSTLAIWTHASGKKRLYQLDVQNGGAVDPLYAFVYAINAAKSCLLFTRRLSATATDKNTMDFGSDGLLVHGFASDGTECYGCSVFISTSGDALLTPGGDTTHIRAYYK